jgi:outer membrane receptor protein involved in Fe transport
MSQFSGEGPPNYSVAYIIDDIDFSGIGSIGSSFDLEQVEVYKGPQSNNFGPNAMAGAINLRSMNPTPFLSGKALVGVPIMEKLQGSVFQTQLQRQWLFE